MGKWILFLLSLPATALGSSGNAHNDPVIPVLLTLTVITFIALVGREIAKHFHQPSVLGELTIGILIGNVGYWLGSDIITILRDFTTVFIAWTETIEQSISMEAALLKYFTPDQAQQLLPILSSSSGRSIIDIIQVIDIFSRIGLLFLLFVVGLESSIHQLRSSIRPGIRVAALGIGVPFVLGIATMTLLYPLNNWPAILMTAIALCATSIGITAHVFHEMSLEQSQTAHIVLSAAVIDDVLGLILMAIGIDIIFRGGFELTTVLYSISQAVMFLTSIYLLVPILIRFTINRLHHFPLWEAELFVSFFLLTILSWLADFVGLSAIVGAFAAGLILSNKEFIYWKKKETSNPCFLNEEIKTQIRPFEAILAPLFFVLMGTQVKLEAFLDFEVVLLATALTVVAISGKMVSGLGAPPNLSRMAIGAGMVPRGEVSLILASLGKTLNILTPTLFTAIVMMTIITTLLGPPLLKAQLDKSTP